MEDYNSGEEEVTNGEIKDFTLAFNNLGEEHVLHALQYSRP